MREPERIDRILGKLGRLWKQFPDQRLGQLVDNYVIPSGAPAYETMPLRNQEDTETEEILDVMLAEQEKARGCYMTGCDKEAGGKGPYPYLCGEHNENVLKRNLKYVREDYESMRKGLKR